MANSVYQLNILGNLDGQFVENVLYFEDEDDAGPEDPQNTATNLIQAWQAALEADWASITPTAYTILGYKAKRVNNGGGPTMAQPVASIPGTRTGALTEQAAGPCFIIPYSHAGAFHAGRIFVPGITATDCIGGVIQGGLSTVLSTVAGDLASTFTDGTGGPTWHFTIWSRKFSIANVIASISVSLKVGIQRRRLTPAM